MGPGETEPDPGYLGVFVAAARSVLHDMAGLDAAARPTAAAPADAGTVSAVIPLGGEGFLALALPRPAAVALADRVLGGAAGADDDAMTRDCVGEVANVVAGQAKALLAGTPWHFHFGPPVPADGPPALPTGGWEAATLVTVVGEVRLAVRRPAGG